MSIDPGVSEKQTFSKRRALLFILTFSIWLFFLVRSIQVFMPGASAALYLLRRFDRLQTAF